jgi:hypothetical protein
MMQEKAITGVLLIALVGVGLVFGQIVAGSPDVTAALMTTGVISLLCLGVVAREKDDGQFLMRVWLIALGLRLAVALAVYTMDVRDNIAPDWRTYDFFGNELCRAWQGARDTGAEWLLGPMAKYRSGWGMYYYVAALYYVIGQNPLAIQLINCILGANACVLTYKIARLVYPGQRVARMSAVLVTVAPSMLIWTSQGIKESPIIFFLCLSLYLTLKLSRRITLGDCFLLLLSLLSIYALRHYVFFVVFLAAGGGLLFASKRFSPMHILQGGLAVTVIGLIFAYYGAGEVANRSFDLEKIQSGRVWSANVSGSGYGADVDITDTRAALVYLPLGTLFFLFAPFPWMVRSLNHILILPEMVVWWLSAPFLFKGLWLGVRQRLRETLTITLFTAGLTFAYALYLTNFGTSHRMRVQILGFFIIFVSIGWEARRVAKEQKRARLRSAQSRFGRPGRTPVPAMSAKQIH